MNHLDLRFFGRFEVVSGTGGQASLLDGRKVQELLSFLVLERSRMIQRERIADNLWPGLDPLRSKKYLRQALWQLQKSLDPDDRAGPDSARLLVVESDWIGIAPDAGIAVDVMAFDAVYERALAARAGGLDAALRREMRQAVDLYRDDLLDGWYCDWALHHRDVYRSRLLVLLDKLVLDAESEGAWDLGIAYGQRALTIDPASERVHVGMMRLHCMAGNRTAALRQFDRCVRSLREELDVSPEPATRRFEAMIRSEDYAGVADLGAGARGRIPEPAGDTSPATSTLHELNRSLIELQGRVALHLAALNS